MRKLNNGFEVGLVLGLVFFGFFSPEANWRNRKDRRSSYCALAAPSW